MQAHIVQRLFQSHRRLVRLPQLLQQFPDLRLLMFKRLIAPSASVKGWCDIGRTQCHGFKLGGREWSPPNLVARASPSGRILPTSQGPFIRTRSMGSRSPNAVFLVQLEVTVFSPSPFVLRLRVAPGTRASLRDRTESSSCAIRIGRLPVPVRWRRIAGRPPRANLCGDAPSTSSCELGWTRGPPPVFDPREDLTRPASPREDPRMKLQRKPGRESG